MATRSRTLLFLQYRNSFARSSISRPTVSGNSFDPYAANESAGLIESSDHVIELSILPPKWVDIADEVDEEIEQIKTSITTLEGLHKKHILPGFEDRSEEEEKIEKLTREITKLFHQCHDKIRRIADESRLSSITSQEESMSKNIQTRLAMKLQDLSSNFRKQQSSYMKKLKVRESRSSPLFSLDSRTSSDNTSDDLELGFTLEQREIMESTEIRITQREQEINEIAKSIQELADIFRELQTLVIDQGTMLDRIDYNVEQMSVNVKSAVRELDQVGL
ncbi:13909_t:CDS:2 [Ambispora leptoticha]|uniref:13909_t:CDS:1 n=1 Tax=Ambispora leptoticha TaxID=144679 RepID=A0A9N9AGP2_9GLOM|nr:13909_t:CDS:2 [Ambispora leptoticha]